MNSQQAYRQDAQAEQRGQCRRRRPRRSRRSLRSPHGVATRQRIPFGHKIAARPIATGEPIVQVRPDHRLRQPADRGGRLGARAQCRDARFRARLSVRRWRARPENVLPVEEQATFEGFRRANGKVGTRNYIGILTSVNCSATVARFIAEAANRSGILERLSEHRRRRRLHPRHRLRHGRLAARASTS